MIESVSYHYHADRGSRVGAGLLVALLCVGLAPAQEIPVQLSPPDKVAARAAAAGYPQLPHPDSKNYRMTAALATSPLRTQEIALVTVTIVFSNATVMVHDTNGVMQPYLSAEQPLVISVKTNHYDVWRAKKVK